jgi:hypothetical protein
LPDNGGLKEIFMDRADIAGIVNTQRAFFNTGKTKDLSLRIAQLTVLRKSVLCRSFLLDLKLRYAAYGNKLPWVKKLLRHFG